MKDKMKVILGEHINQIWDIIDRDFHFRPSIDVDTASFAFPVHAACFRLKSVWDDRQEAIVNGIMMDLFPEEALYALDWQHDCFLFSPKEQIPPNYRYYDKERKCQVFFPTYYPDGDYHFFVDTNFRAGLFGHPWQEKIYVIGSRLICAIKEKQQELDLEIL